MSDASSAPTRPVAEAVPASTIVLMRDSARGPEVLMVVRHHQIDFASGALVFPGGKIDPQDMAPAVLAHVDGTHGPDIALRVGAIREAYEESGILLANTADGHVAGAALLASLEAQRKQVHEGSLPFERLLSETNLRLRCDELVHFAHWITPTMMPKRFDTHFYIARVPPDQIAAHDGRESVDAVWVTPADAIADAKTGKRTIIFPTLRNLEKLLPFASVHDAIEQTRASNIVPVLPWTEQRADGRYLCIPPEAGYAVSEELMPAAPR